ncbi:hypothetical protein H0H81_001315 [Sphagnurus paluster]|uniref:Uncharacterized protein n=1 Tax=Sphagnurus paluster TaxID=117069 RepID=A0A9P7GG42_9AGAR|nr:hypothetical protein H0H81_001315 [Sphagnurus paluster]
MICSQSCPGSGSGHYLPTAGPTSAQVPEAPTSKKTTWKRKYPKYGSKPPKRKEKEKANDELDSFQDQDDMIVIDSDSDEVDEQEDFREQPPMKLLQGSINHSGVSLSPSRRCHRVFAPPMQRTTSVLQDHATSKLYLAAIQALLETYCLDIQVSTDLPGEDKRIVGAIHLELYGLDKRSRCRFDA